MRTFIIKTIATFFYIGYLPLIPGTFGSIAGIFLFYFVKNNLLAQFLLSIVLITLGFLVSGASERIFAKKDARYIVIDEISGMFLALLFIPFNLKLIITAFILFRILDTFKPYPAARLERLSGSLGIMGDDLVAGVYTNIILQIALRLASSTIS